jgi:transcriptional regulator GlxA family with amidase domain
MRVIVDHLLDDCPPLDWLLVPGGWGTRREAGNRTLVSWIGERSRGASLTASICTGARLLAAAGLLDGRRATTHWNSLGWLADNYPKVKVEQHLHVVDDGNLLTSAGISAGIELALALVARECGEAVTHNLARYMEYPYPHDNSRRVEIGG